MIDLLGVRFFLVCFGCDTFSKIKSGVAERFVNQVIPVEKQ